MEDAWYIPNIFVATNFVGTTENESTPPNNSNQNKHPIKELNDNDFKRDGNRNTSRGTKTHKKLHSTHEAQDKYSSSSLRANPRQEAKTEDKNYRHQLKQHQNPSSRHIKNGHIGREQSSRSTSRDKDDEIQGQFLTKKYNSEQLPVSPRGRHHLDSSGPRSTRSRGSSLPQQPRRTHSESRETGRERKTSFGSKPPLSPAGNLVLKKAAVGTRVSPPPSIDIEPPLPPTSNHSFISPRSLLSYARKKLASVNLSDDNQDNKAKKTSFFSPTSPPKSPPQSHLVRKSPKKSPPSSPPRDQYGRSDTDVSSSPPPPPRPNQKSSSSSPPAPPPKRYTMNMAVPTLNLPPQHLDSLNNDDKTNHLKKIIALRKERDSQDDQRYDDTDNAEKSSPPAAMIGKKKPIKKKTEVLHDQDWTYLTRPEIKRSDLHMDAVIDERHDKRQVRCVVWDNPSLHNERETISSSSFGYSISQKKQVKERFALKISARGKHDEFCKDVLIEKQIMTALDNQWHTKLVNTYISDNNLYMLLEYFPLKSVDTLLQKNKRLNILNEKSVRFYAACIFKGIVHMHKKGIIHRDLKLSNLLIDHQGYLKICDYGLSKFLDLGNTTRTFLGTMQYIAPEMMREDNTPYSHSVDLWSFGICCYEMLYGETPFEAKELAKNVPEEVSWNAETKHNVLNGQLKFPAQHTFSGVVTVSFLTSLLDRNPHKRLGSPTISLFEKESSKKKSISSKSKHMKMIYEDIQKHDYFNALDFEMLEKRSLASPKI